MGEEKKAADASVQEAFSSALETSGFLTGLVEDINQTTATSVAGGLDSGTQSLLEVVVRRLNDEANSHFVEAMKMNAAEGAVSDGLTEEAEKSLRGCIEGLQRGPCTTEAGEVVEVAFCGSSHQLPTDMQQGLNAFMASGVGRTVSVTELATITRAIGYK